MAGIDNAAILMKTDYQFKGPLTENYVLQQLRGQFTIASAYIMASRIPHIFDLHPIDTPTRKWRNVPDC